MLLLALLVGVPSCASSHSPAAQMPDWPHANATRVAVAPALNFSAEPTLDPVRLADLLASELTGIRGVTVVPVSRVAAAVARSGDLRIQSPAHALSVCRDCGADAVLVPAVTEYNPYSPMVVGLAMELYLLDADTQESVSGGPGIRPAAVGQALVIRPVAQVQVVYDASHKAVTEAVRRFARTRTAEAGPTGWRRYLVTQEGYLRFCFHDALGRLLGSESEQMPGAETTDG